MSKAVSYVCVRYKCKGNQITVYTTSGIKLAGSQYRVLDGTGEVGTIRFNRKAWALCQPKREAVIQGLYEVSVAD